jgi:hypothetical protein
LKRFYLVTVLITLFASSAVFCATATLDLNKKTLSSDAATIECKNPRIDGEQVGLYIISKSLQPQDFILETNGLSRDSYDIYINGNYTGIQSVKQLQDGIEMSLPGTLGLPIQMRCLNALKDKIKPEIDRLTPNRAAEPQRVLWTLRQADEWVASGIRCENAYRSMDIVIAPEGSVLKKMTFRTRLDADGTVKTIYNACNLLQHARSRMYENIKDPVLRNKAVEVMTPVTFKVSYQLANSEPNVTATVVNDCDLPVNGNITFALPKGWKTDSKQLFFNNLESGKTYKTSFRLIAPSKTATVPESLPIAANISLKEGKYEAKLKLRMVQLLGS